MAPTSRDYRHAIVAAFKAYAQEEGGFRSHMTSAYVDYMMMGRPGLTGEQQMVFFSSVHTAFLNLLNDAPQNEMLHLLHNLIHQAILHHAAKNNIPDEITEKDDGVDPFLTHKDDFVLWSKDLPSAHQIEQEEMADKEDTDD